MRPLENNAVLPRKLKVELKWYAKNMWWPQSRQERGAIETNMRLEHGKERARWPQNPSTSTVILNTNRRNSNQKPRVGRWDKIARTKYVLYPDKP